MRRGRRGRGEATGPDGDVRAQRAEVPMAMRARQNHQPRRQRAKGKRWWKAGCEGDMRRQKMDGPEKENQN